MQKEGAIISNIVPIELATPFPEGSVNVYLLLGDPVTLVDTGTWQADSVYRLRSAISQVGLDFGDIEQVVITHMHTDHSGLKQGKRTVFDISSSMFPWLKGRAVFLGLSEVLGHLDLLADEGRVTMEDENEVLVFRPT